MNECNKSNSLLKALDHINQAKSFADKNKKDFKLKGFVAEASAYFFRLINSAGEKVQDLEKLNASHHDLISYVIEECQVVLDSEDFMDALITLLRNGGNKELVSWIARHSNAQDIVYYGLCLEGNSETSGLFTDEVIEQARKDVESDKVTPRKSPVKKD